VPRHADKRRTEIFEINVQNAGRLRGVQYEWDTFLTAGLRDSFDRLYIAEHIGHMIADHKGSIFRQAPFKGVKRHFRLKQLRRGYLDPCAEGVQGPRYRIMLITGDDDLVVPAYKGFDGKVQRVGTLNVKTMVTGPDLKRRAAASRTGRPSRRHPWLRGGCRAGRR
jgi:hypothetical protein